MPSPKLDPAALLRDAFGREAESVLRCLFFARRADVEGRADVASVLRSIAEGEISQAFGHLELLAERGDAVAGGQDALEDLAAVVAAEEDALSRYTDMSERARAGAATDVADWFESLVQAEGVHLSVLRKVVAER